MWGASIPVFNLCALETIITTKFDFTILFL